MASSLKKLTGMGGDVRKIAALLQAKAPKGHKLAYINDEEAALLKSRGGSGKPHADTGIPSYDVDVPTDIFANPNYADYTPQDAPAPVDTAPVNAAPAFGEQDVPVSPDVAAKVNAPVGQTLPTGERVISPVTYSPNDLARISVGSAPLTQFKGDVAPISIPEPKEQSLADKFANATGLSKDTLKNLGIAGTIGLLGSRQAKKAADTGQAGAQQMQQLAAPYQKAGADLQAQAQRGELTAAGQQQLQAIQAQAAQGAEKRGGVGAAQVQAQVEAFRQQLLAQQYDYGLKLSGVGDNIALGAIKTGLQADQYVNQLTNSYYTNMARALYGTTPQNAGVATTAGGN